MLFSFARKSVTQRYVLEDIEVEVQIAVKKDWEGFHYETHVYQLSDIVKEIKHESELKLC